MSAIQTRRFTIEYRWEFPVMIPWYRQALSMFYGIGVVMIALWALEQGSGGAWMILGVVGMSMLTLTLIFGVEIDSVRVGNKVVVEFSETSNGESPPATTDDEEDADSIQVRNNGK